MSSIIAVAGGTGGLGRAIVEAIIARGGFQVFILSREANQEKEKEIGARIIPVDYADADALSKVLEENKVDTVISALSVLSDISPELSLISAADKSTTTTRFVPSIWGVEYTEELAKIFPPAIGKRSIVQAVAGTSLEYTVWYNGYFADYFGAPHLNTYLKAIATVLDIPNNTAGIPGSGNVPVVLTYTFDIAKFVAASLTLPKWEPETYVIGDKVTWNELLAIAEEAKGVKFTVSYDSLETLKAGKITELPSHVHLYPFWPKEQLQGLFATFGVMFETGVFDLKPQHSINDDFPDIKPKTIKELVTEAWKGK